MAEFKQSIKARRKDTSITEIYSGFLWKCGKGMVKSWKLRYFLLTDKYELTYSTPEMKKKR